MPLPEKSEYKLDEYWDALQKDHDAFNNGQDATDAEDEAAYQLMKKTVEEMSQQYRHLKTVSYFSQAREGAKLAKIPENNFGKSNLPEVKGSKSKQYAEAVYMKHLQRYDKLKPTSLENQGSRAVIGCTIEENKNTVREQAQELQRRIDAYTPQKANEASATSETGAVQVASSSADDAPASDHSKPITIDTLIAEWITRDETKNFITVLQQSTEEALALIDTEPKEVMRILEDFYNKIHPTAPLDQPPNDEQTTEIYDICEKLATALAEKTDPTTKGGQHSLKTDLSIALILKFSDAAQTIGDTLIKRSKSFLQRTQTTSGSGSFFQRIFSRSSTPTPEKEKIDQLQTLLKAENIDPHAVKNCLNDILANCSSDTKELLFQAKLIPTQEAKTVYLSDIPSPSDTTPPLPTQSGLPTAATGAHRSTQQRGDDPRESIKVA